MHAHCHSRPRPPNWYMQLSHFTVSIAVTYLSASIDPTTFIYTALAGQLLGASSKLFRTFRWTKQFPMQDSACSKPFIKKLLHAFNMHCGYSKASSCELFTAKQASPGIVLEHLSWFSPLMCTITTLPQLSRLVLFAQGTAAAAGKLFFC